MRVRIQQSEIPKPRTGDAPVAVAPNTRLNLRVTDRTPRVSPALPRPLWDGRAGSAGLGRAPRSEEPSELRLMFGTHANKKFAPAAVLG